MPKTMKRFSVEIETELEVDAFDEDSARKKAARALARRQRLSDHVRTSGRGRPYAVSRVVTDTVAMTDATASR